MEYEVKLSPNVCDLLETILSTYTGFRQPQEYGISAFQFWYYRIKAYISQIGNSTKRHKNSDGKYVYQMEYWGNLLYERFQFKNITIYRVVDLIIDKVNLYEWIYDHQYPTKSNLQTPIKSKPIRYFKKKLTPIFGLHIIKIWGQEKYNLLNNNGEIVLQEWVDEVKPLKVKEPYGTYKLIAHCNHRGFLSGISVDGKLYDTERSWKSAYSESYINNNELQYLITEAINNIELNKKYQQIMQNYYKSLHILLL